MTIGISGRADDAAGISVRKRRHIDVCLTENVENCLITTGFERYLLSYNGLTQTNLETIDLSVEFLGARLRAPMFIGAMTGGAALSRTINRNLGAAAQELGVGMMLGSQRVMLDSALGEVAAESFAIRDVAPDVFLIGNIGLAQVSGAVVADLAKALARVGADALAVHTNPLQEAVQSGGDTDFRGSIGRLGAVAESLDYPVLLKEVGHGLGATAMAELLRLPTQPLAAIDVAGAGGTSWSRVEQFVRYGGIRNPALADWGVPTAQAINEVRSALPNIPLVGSGGIRTGMDAAKAIALGANVVAVARPLLAPAIESSAAVVDWIGGFLDELRICMHGCGAPDIAALARTTLTNCGPVPAHGAVARRG